MFGGCSRRCGIERPRVGSRKAAHPQRTQIHAEPMWAVYSFLCVLCVLCGSSVCARRNGTNRPRQGASPHSLARVSRAVAGIVHSKERMTHSRQRRVRSTAGTVHSLAVASYSLAGTAYSWEWTNDSKEQVSDSLESRSIPASDGPSRPGKRASAILCSFTLVQPSVRRIPQGAWPPCRSIPVVGPAPAHRIPATGFGGLMSTVAFFSVASPRATLSAKSRQLESGASGIAPVVVMLHTQYLLCSPNVVSCP